MSPLSPTSPAPDPSNALTPIASVAEVEATPLRELVHHREWVPCDTLLEDLHRFFSDRDIEFAALVREGQVNGICARSQLGFLLGSRFGFALNARNPAHQAGVKRPLVFEEHRALRDVLHAALGRHGDEFYEDVALVEKNLRLIGLIPVESLVRIQSRLVSAQLEEMRRQNVELFAAGHAVRQAQALSAGLFASSAVGVGLLTAAGRLQSCNRRLGELLGLALPLPAELPMERWIAEPEQPQWRELLLALERSKQPNCTRDFELEVPGRGRRIMRFSLGWIAETSQICLCADDMTQQREIERRLQRDEKQTLLDTLAGGVAHELNNKLTPVLGYAELLAQDATAAQKNYVGHIRKGVQESANIIRQLLRLAKPEGGRPEIVDLGEVIREAALMLRFQVSEAGAELHLETGTAPLLVECDAAQLKQVLMNLALNALHAMEGVDQPALTIATGCDATGVFFSVRDNGTGIPHDLIGRIFDPFFTTKGPDKGTGLGLSICHSIIRQHNGEIKVRSQPGKGSCFTVRLPLPATTATLTGRNQSALDGSARQPSLIRRVLVVEDEQVIRNYFQEVMRKLYDCVVDEAADGSEGLALVQQHDYDLILSDIRMPVMTGPELYIRMKECRPAQAEKLIFVTGHVGQNQLQDDIAHWGVPLLTKPFTMSRLAKMCDLRIARAAKPQTPGLLVSAAATIRPSSGI